MTERNTAQYKGFTISMALVDFIPIIFFCISGFIIFNRISSYLFIGGILLCTCAGLCKAGWKLIVSTLKKDYIILPKIFHVLMPIGFGVMATSIFFRLEAWGMLLKNLLMMPSLLLIVLGCIGMGFMVVFAIKLNGNSAKNNWIEQLTNTVSQMFFAIALIIS